jgi:hypothetical protein
VVSQINKQKPDLDAFIGGGYIHSLFSFTTHRLHHHPTLHAYRKYRVAYIHNPSFQMLTLLYPSETLAEEIADLHAPPGVRKNLIYSLDSRNTVINVLTAG